jgi:hypothetical protein
MEATDARLDAEDAAADNQPPRVIPDNIGEGLDEVTFDDTFADAAGPSDTVSVGSIDAEEFDL